MKKGLLYVSLVEGAAVMAAELCGAKLLAPVFGSSLYVWASVMGMTLMALAFGYFSGGLFSQKKKKEYTHLYYVLLAASLFMLAMPVISYYLIQRISYLPFAPGVIISTFILLFLPVFFLGASSPLFISIQSKQQEQAGKVSGTVYAISTLGGILSTFLCGFYLIPELGLHTCILIFSLLLLLSTLIVFKLFKIGYMIVFASVFYLNLKMNLKGEDTLMLSDGLLGRLEVKEVKNTATTYRLLSINDIVQTEMDLDSKKSKSAYIQILDSLIPSAKSVKNALVLGLGGGLSSNLLIDKNYKTDGVEFDSRIIEAGKNYFFMNEKVKMFCEDARYYLNHCKKQYDVILFDVFKAEEQPSHVITLESLIQLKKNLSKDALIFINWHGYLSGQIGEGTRILYQTLLRAGYAVKLCSNTSDEDTRNIIFVASLQTMPELAFEIKEEIDYTSKINTDDLCLMEKYNAQANKTWRLHYLRYYQRVE